MAQSISYITVQANNGVVQQSVVQNFACIDAANSIKYEQTVSNVQITRPQAQQQQQQQKQKGGSVATTQCSAAQNKPPLSNAQPQAQQQQQQQQRQQQQKQNDGRVATTQRSAAQNKRQERLRKAMQAEVEFQFKRSQAAAAARENRRKTGKVGFSGGSVSGGEVVTDISDMPQQYTNTQQHLQPAEQQPYVVTPINPCPPLHKQPNDQELLYVPTKLESGANFFFASYSINGICSNPANKVVSKIKLSNGIQKAKHMGQKLGFESVKGLFTETPLGNTIRDFAVYGWFMLCTAIFITKLVDILKNGTEKWVDIATIAIGSVGTLLSFVDIVVHLWRRKCKTCTEWHKCCKETCERENDEKKGEKDKEDNENDKEDNENNKEDNENVKEDNKNNKKQKQDAKGGCCSKQKCSTALAIDIARLFLIELLFYPDLVIQVFSFVDLGVKNLKATDYLDLLFGFVSEFFFVYVVRILVLFGTVWSIRTDVKTSWQGFCFHLSFVFYAIGQMVIQMLMIVMLGFKFQAEYPEDDDEKESHIPSGRLIYMAIVGYLYPPIATLMFLLLHQYWVRKFPIELWHNYLKVGNKGHNLANTMSFPNTYQKEAEKTSEESIKIFASFKEEEYENHNNKSIETKICLPFASPLRVVLCLMYTAALIVFYVFFFVGYNSDTVIGTWFAVAGIILTILVNIYTVVIVLCYLFILFSILIIVVMVCVLCVCMSTASSSNRPQNNKHYRV